MDRIKLVLKIFTVLLILVLGLTACSDNSTGSDSESGFSEGSFTVSGALNDEKNGQSVFWSISVQNLHQWVIHISDDINGSNNTYDLTLSIVSSEPIGHPGPGTYSIGPSNTMDASVFSVIYYDISKNKIFFAEQDETGGSLTITESEANRVKGTFQFEAADMIEDKVSIAGEFNASLQN